MEWEPGVSRGEKENARAAARGGGGEEGLTPVVNEIETESNPPGAAVVLDGNRYDSFARENKLDGFEDARAAKIRFSPFRTW